MDLRRSRRRALLAPLVAAVLAGCAGETPLEYREEALRLPATLKEALRLAESLAQDRIPGAYVTRFGGGFTVMDDTGRARNHTFVFHARPGRAIFRRITVHLIHGTPWVDDVTVPDVPPPFQDPDAILDSDSVVARAITLAPIHAVPLPTDYSARLSTIPAWPEPEFVGDPGEEIAWRVDFLVLQPLTGGAAEVYFSTARFYFDPTTGELLGEPVVPTTPELYPFP